LAVAPVVHMEWAVEVLVAVAEVQGEMLVVNQVV
jgi:hypothetical protein